MSAEVSEVFPNKFAAFNIWQHWILNPLHLTFLSFYPLYIKWAVEDNKKSHWLHLHPCGCSHWCHFLVFDFCLSSTFSVQSTCPCHHKEFARNTCQQKSASTVNTLNSDFRFALLRIFLLFRFHICFHILNFLDFTYIFKYHICFQILKKIFRCET